MWAKQFCVVTAIEYMAEIRASNMHLSPPPPPPPPPPPVTFTALRSKAVVLLLLIYCFMYFPLFVGVLCLSLFCYTLLCIHSSLAIVLKRKRKLAALLLLSNRCIGTVNSLWLFLTVPWVGLEWVIVVFPDQTYLTFKDQCKNGTLNILGSIRILPTA